MDWRYWQTIPLHLTKYFPAYKMKLPETRYDVLMKAKQIAKQYLDYVYVGNVWIDNNTYCPNCCNELIDRYYGADIVGIKNNRCSNCNKKLNIIY